MNKTTSVFVAAALSAVVSFAAPRKAADITVSGYTGSTSLENFPVLVRISPERISGFSYADCAADGHDIAFADAQGNALAREIDTWDPNGESLVWVRVPSLENSVVLTMTYQDSSVTAQPACQTDGSVWTSAGYAGVWHMNEASGAVADATGHGLDATPAGNTANSIAAAGKVGTARQTATSAERGYLSVPNYNALALGGTFTMSGWVYFTGVSGYPRLFSRKKNYGDADGWEIEMQNNQYTKFTARGIGNSSKVDGTIPTLQNSWVHLAFVYDGTALTAYANGNQVASGTIQAATDNGYPLSLGCDSDGNEAYVRGFFDECRLLGAAASGDWVAASYATQSSDAFLTYGRSYHLFSDNLLIIEAAPAEIGAPTPAYGQILGLADNDARSLSMAATTVAGEGTVTNYLTGWKLESVDMETAARTLLRSSSDTGEVFNRCDYVHAGCAAFTWLWDVRDVIGVGAPTLVANGVNSLTLSANVTGIGYTAPSATLKYVYGVSPDALAYTNVASASVTEIGPVSATLTRLTPGVVYYVKAVLETNDAAHDAVESAAVAFQTEAVVDVGEPGLWQTFFTSANADWTKDIWAVPEGTDWKNYTDANRIRRRELTPIGAYLGGNPGATKYTSELWGDEVYWPVNGGQWVYAGNIWLESTKSYKFRASIDDADRIVITDSGTGVETVLISDTTYNTADTSAAYSPSVTGWHYIEIRLSDGTGGAGGTSNASSYKNTTNLGFSQDGGATWELLTDPGDGSLFRSPDSKSGSAITATENIAAGALASVSLAFASVDSARALCAAWGPAYGGEKPADWYATNAIATVAAGATSATWTPPADWGSDSNLVVRFYFDGDPAKWSNAIFWHDYSAPSVTDVAADGTGGDTLVVSGTLASFPGTDCTLSVYMGDSPLTLTNAWTGLAGSTLTAAGDFSFTLFEPDTASPRYLAPGSTHYVAVEAAANGLVTRTVPVEVTLKAAPVFSVSSAAVARRTVTFSGALPDSGAGGSATVRLYVGPASAGEEDLVAVEGPVVVTDRNEFSIAHTFPDFETNYKLQLRATAETDGGTTNFETRTPVATCKTLDTTTYTWKTSVTSGNWSDAANWTDNQGGDCLGYPQSSAASAVFPDWTAASVAFTEALAVGTVNMTANNIELAFTQGGASTNETKMTVNTLNFNGGRGYITLDGVAISTGGGVTLGANRALTLVNGANLYTVDFSNENYNDVTVAGGSWFSCNQMFFGSGTITIDDSVVWTRSHDYVGRTRTGGHVVFKGAHPVWRHNNTGGYFFSNIANANVQLDFVVPVGGFPEAPIQAPANQNFVMGNNGNSAGSCPLTVNVLDESPANFADATITAPLILWPTKGINKNMVLEGHLPEDGASTDDAFVWGDASSYPQTLSVRIAGSSHAGQIQVSGVPEAVEAAELSPAYGYAALAENATRTCTAPSGYVQISADKRAICTGWKLYDVNASTLERTLADSGTGTSCSVTGNGGWRELEWQWRVEYRVSATAGDNGSAAVAEEWVADGGLATVTATPAAGYAFYKWTGDVDASNDKTQDLTFQVSGTGYALTATFLRAYYVSTTGSDANGGTGWDDALATVQAALAKDANAYIYVADGIYPQTDTITLSGGATIAGTNNACGAIFKAVGTISNGSLFLLKHVDARLLRIAITTGFTGSNGDFARGVYLDGNGLVDSCVITNCRSHYCGGNGGGGVYLNGGGIVRNTILDYNSTYASGGNNAKGHNICMTGGLVEHCSITRGGVRYGASSSGGGVFMQGGTLRNCLVSGGTQGHDNADGATGVLVFNGGASLIENCTIAGNYHNTSVQTKAFYVNSGANCTIRNSIIWGNVNNGGTANWGANGSANLTAEKTCSLPALPGRGNISLDPAFVDENGGDYRLTLSAAVDGAAPLSWMAAATDLDGNPRVIGAGADLGCYEFASDGLSCGLDVATAGILDTDDVTLSARVAGGDPAALNFAWTLTDTVGNIIVTNGVGLATVTIPVPAGLYDVSLVVSGGTDSASSFRPALLRVYGGDVYVDPAGGNVYPYATRATAATNLLDAIEAAADGTTVHLSDGWHRIARTLTVGVGAHLVSDNGPAATTIFGRSISSGSALVILNHADAVVDGVTISGKDSDGTQPQQWSGVRIAPAGGMLTNCVVRDHKTVSISVNGAGARLEGGTVVDCVFSNNFVACSGGGGMRGGAIDMTGARALVDRCLIANNRIHDGGISYGGGVYANNGTVRNCLIVGNSCNNGYGGGLAVTGSGRAINCTVVRNTATIADGGIWQGGGTVQDCLVWSSMANGNPGDLADPGFVDAENGDYHLNVASSAVDSGTASDPGPLDLDRMPRVSGPAADKGCYEYDKSQFSIGTSYSSESFFADTPVVLDALATPEGTVIDEAQSWWTFDGTEPSASNHDAVGSSVTNLFGLGAWTVRFKTVYNGQTYTVDKPEWFTRYGRTVYLVQENPGAAFPYGTPETAATNVNDAVLAAMDGATILVGDGTFPFKNGVKYIGRNLVVRSQNGPWRTTFDADGKNALFFILAGDWKVVIDGIRFVNGSGYVDGGAIRINDADSVITNCVFDSCRASSYGGGGIFADAGTIVDCLFTNCWCGGGNGPVGAVIRATSANCLVDRCILLDSHYVHDAATVTRAALYVNNGIVRNTVVARSRLTGEGGIVAAGSAKVQNCTVVDNVSELTGYVAGIKVEGSATVKNTILWHNVNEADNARAEMGGDASRFDHCFTDDPGLVGKRGREFQIRSNSPCRNAGVTESWMRGALDFYGNPRIDNPKRSVDIGAAECQKTEGTMLIMR